MKKLIFVLFIVCIFLQCYETEGRGGGRGGGGGGRGGGSRGSSKGSGGSKGGWFSSSGSSSKSSSFGKGTGSWGGKSVVGTYQTFGSPSRWSMYHGRSYYFVGYPYGHRYYGYHGSRYRNELDDEDSLSPWTIMILVLLGINLTGFSIWLFVWCHPKPKGMGAAALIILILLLIGLGVAFYYTVLCLQARPNKRKQFSTSDRGHLLANDPDLNGNVDEEIAIDTVDSNPSNVDPKLEDDSLDNSMSKENEMESLLLKSVPFQVTPQCAAKDSKAVFIHVEDEPSPNEADTSIRHISPVNMSLSAKYCVASNLDEFLPRDNCSGALSDSFEEDGLMVPRTSTNATSNSQKVNESEPSSSLPSEGDSYYDLTKDKKQVHFVAQEPNPISSDVKAAVNIQCKNEEIPILVSLQLCEDLNESVPNKRIVDVEDQSFPVDSVESVSHPQASDISTIDPPYPITPSHPYADLHSLEEQPKSYDYVIVNPIYAQLQKSNPDVSISIEGSNVESGPLGWHVPISEMSSKDECKELTECSDLEATPFKINDSIQEDVVDSDRKPTVVKVLFPSDENVSGPSSPSLETYSPCIGAESGTDSSSEPDVTEYSFITGPKVPSTALVLADEVSFYSDPKITSIVTLSELSAEPSQDDAVMEQPPTPISDENSRSCSAQSDLSCNTRSISDIDEGNANDNSPETNNTLNQLSNEECFTITNPNVLGTPPTTPPELKVSSGLIIDNRHLAAELHSTNPELFPDIMNVNDPNINFRGRSSSNSSMQSSSSSTSSSSTNGSYKIHSKDDGGESEVLKSVTDDKSKIPILKK